MIMLQHNMKVGYPAGSFFLIESDGDNTDSGRTG